MLCCCSFVSTGAPAALHGAMHGGHHPGGHGNGNGSYSLNLSHAGSRIHYALRSIFAGVTGTHIPGEYGRDPLAAALAEEQQLHMRSSYSASLLHSSPLHTQQQQSVQVPAGVTGGAGVCFPVSIIVPALRVSFLARA